LFLGELPLLVLRLFLGAGAHLLGFAGSRACCCGAVEPAVAGGRACCFGAGRAAARCRELLLRAGRACCWRAGELAVGQVELAVAGRSACCWEQGVACSAGRASCCCGQGETAVADGVCAGVVCCAAGAAVVGALVSARDGVLCRQEQHVVPELWLLPGVVVLSAGQHVCRSIVLLRRSIVLCGGRRLRPALVSLWPRSSEWSFAGHGLAVPQFAGGFVALATSFVGLAAVACLSGAGWSRVLVRAVPAQKLRFRCPGPVTRRDFVGMV